MNYPLISGADFKSKKALTELTETNVLWEICQSSLDFYFILKGTVSNFYIWLPQEQLKMHIDFQVIVYLGPVCFVAKRRKS